MQRRRLGQLERYLAFDACRPAGSCVGSDGKAVANGGAEQRTRYRESIVTGGAPFNPSTS